jgi:hypothetical protein
LSVDPPVLPRPNLGPEPWPDAPIWPWVAAAAGFVLIMLVALVIRRRRRKARARAAAAIVPDVTPSASSEPPPPTDLVRVALIRAFGPSWRARTTEEIAASPVLGERFGAEVAGRVVAYLGAIDRAKFSADAAAPAEELEWWASRFAEEVDAKNMNDSTIKNGRKS